MKILNLKMYSKFIYPRLLTDNERFALFCYTSTAFSDINNSLRSNGTKYQKEYIDYIDSAIKKFSFDTKLRTYRTVYTGDIKVYKGILDMCKRGLLIEKAYTSTSLCNIFGKQNSGFITPGFKIITYDIEIPSTVSNCAYIPSLSRKPDEEEVILKRGSSIEVINYEEYDNELNINGKLLIK